MKIETKIKKLNPDALVLEIKPYQRNWLEAFEGKELTVTISDKKDRTLHQNSKLWALVHEIEKEMNGYTSKQGEEDLYMQLLDAASIEPDFLMMLPEAAERFKGSKDYRVIKEIEQRDYNNQKMAVLKCYRGSSRFNTAEMSDFIESVLRFASENQIKIIDYEGYFK